MKDRELFRLMQLIPEKFPEETAAFLAEHRKAGQTEPPGAVIRQKKQTDPHNSILWRVLPPVGAAACLAVMIGAGIWTGLQEKPLNTASSEPEMTEIAEQTGTTVPGTVLTDAEQHTGTVTKTVTGIQQQVQQGTAAPVQGDTVTVTAAPDTTVKQQTAAPRETEPAPETAASSAGEPAPQYLPGDVDMDGKVTVTDAQILLQEYIAVVQNGGESILTPQQIAIGDVYPNTVNDDLSVFNCRLLSAGNPRGRNGEYSMVATDYPISYEDVHLVLDYYVNMYVGGYRGNFGDLNVIEYGQYLGLPPEDPEIRFISEPVIMQGDSLPADSVTIRNLGSYPVHTENWEMTYASVEHGCDFRLWYDGRGAFEGCEILLTGTASQGKVKTDYQYGYLEEKETDEYLEIIKAGDTRVYHDLPAPSSPSGENWRAEEWPHNSDDIYWRTGDCIMRLFIKVPYPEEKLQQIADFFVALPQD